MNNKKSKLSRNKKAKSDAVASDDRKLELSKIKIKGNGDNSSRPETTVDQNKCSTESALSKVEKMTTENICANKICESCRHGTKIKYRTQLQVSIKSKKCSHHSDKKEEDTKLKPDVLLYFLDQMRKIVIQRNMDLGTLKTISEKLLKDKLDVELLLLMDLIIRFQVGELKDIIFKDLLSIEILPENFVKAFLKQYIFLKNLSQEYSQIMHDYETAFLCTKELSFDSICRAHFKVHLYDSCNEIQDLIDAGHLDVSEELILDIEVTDRAPERIRRLYADMKTDFRFSAKWKDVQKSVENILSDPYDISRSLLKYFNINFPFLTPKSNCKSVSCPRHHAHQCHSQRCPNHPQHASHCSHLEQQLQQLQHHHHHHQQPACVLPPPPPPPAIAAPPATAATATSNASVASPGAVVAATTTTSTNTNNNCSSIYRHLASVKPPSLSSPSSSASSSSTTNSNEYNSCAASISSSSPSSSSSASPASSPSSSPHHKQQLHQQRHRNKHRLNSDTDDDDDDDEDDEDEENDEDDEENSRRRHSLHHSHNHHHSHHHHHGIKNKLLHKISAIEKIGSPVSFSHDDFGFDNAKCGLSRAFKHKKCLFKESEFNSKADDLNPEDLIAFNKLYEAYLKDNQDLLSENSLSCSTKSMSVPDCIKNFESATNLKYFLNMLMTKYSQHLDDHDSRKCSPSSDHQDLTGPSNSPGSLGLEDRCTHEFSDISIKDDDIDLEFEELSRTMFESDSKSVNESLREFEKYLDNRCSMLPGSGTGPNIRHPNLRALVRSCRIYHNKLYNGSAGDHGRNPAADDGDCCNRSAGESDAEDQGGSNGARVDESMMMMMVDKETHCHNGGGSSSDFIADASTCTAPMSVNSVSTNTVGASTVATMTSNLAAGISSLQNSQAAAAAINSLNAAAAAGHHSAESVSANSNKVCKCCKCEMFGDQPLLSGSGLGAGRGGAGSAGLCADRLRLKLQRRKQQHHNHSTTAATFTTDSETVSIAARVHERHKHTRPATAAINACTAVMPEPEPESPVCGTNNNAVAAATVATINIELPDVDSLVKFINGDTDDYSETSQTPQTQSTVADTPRKTSIVTTRVTGKNKKRKLQQPVPVAMLMAPATPPVAASVAVKTPEDTPATATVVELATVATTTNSAAGSKPSKVGRKKKNNQAKPRQYTVLPDSFKMPSNNTITNGSNNRHQQHHDSSSGSAANESRVSQPQQQHRQKFSSEHSADQGGDDKDHYDPVVENFKMFCEKMVVVPQHRKKLTIDPSLLMKGLQKMRQDTK